MTKTVLAILTAAAGSLALLYVLLGYADDLRAARFAEAYGNWSALFVQEQEGDIQEVLQANDIDEQDLETGLLLLQEKIKQGGDISASRSMMSPELCIRVETSFCVGWMYQRNTTMCQDPARYCSGEEPCITDTRTLCARQAAYAESRCSNPEAYCTSNEFIARQRILLLFGLTNRLALSEFVKNSRMSIGNETPDVISAKVLASAVAMSVHGMLATWASQEANRAFDACLERAGHATEGAIRECTVFTFDAVEALAKKAEENLTYVNSFPSSCSQNLVPLVFEDYRGYLEQNIPETELQMLKINRIILYTALTKCDRVAMNTASSFPCYSIGSVSSVEDFSDGLPEKARNINHITDVALVQASCMTHEISEYTHTLSNETL